MATVMQNLIEETIVETVDLGEMLYESKLDSELGIARDVKILGKISRNGRTYSDDCIRGALAMYEGVKVYIDHPAEGRRASRGTLEQFGIIKNPKIKNGSVYGDLKYLKTHEYAKTFEEVCGDPDFQVSGPGLSHNVLARSRKDKRRKTIVEAILKVNSVDLVSDSATTGGVFESHQTESRNMSNQNTNISEEGDLAQPALAPVPTDTLAPTPASDEPTGTQKEIEDRVLALVRDEKMSPQEKTAKFKDIITRSAKAKDLMNFDDKKPEEPADVASQEAFKIAAKAIGVTVEKAMEIALIKDEELRDRLIESFKSTAKKQTGGGATLPNTTPAITEGFQEGEEPEEARKKRGESLRKKVKGIS